MVASVAWVRGPLARWWRSRRRTSPCSWPASPRSGTPVILFRTPTWYRRGPHPRQCADPCRAHDGDPRDRAAAVSTVHLRSPGMDDGRGVRHDRRARELAVGRRVNRPTFIGYDQIFGFRWPSVFYAIDIVAWDVFFAFAVLFAVPAFAPRSKTSLIRWGLITSGTLSLVGLIGPLVAIWRGERSASWVTPSSSTSPAFPWRSTSGLNAEGVPCGEPGAGTRLESTARAARGRHGCHRSGRRVAPGRQARGGTAVRRSERAAGTQKGG
jgi:hypothetical protein